MTAKVQANGYETITTQIFDSKSKYLDDDSVFAVEDGLKVDFIQRHGDSKSQLELRYDIKMARANDKKKAVL